MIIVMQKGATQEQIDHMIQRVEELGLKSHPIYGTERTVIAAIGDKRDEDRHSLESGPGVSALDGSSSTARTPSRTSVHDVTALPSGSVMVVVNSFAPPKISESLSKPYAVVVTLPAGSSIWIGWSRRSHVVSNGMAAG